jgi:hypothetical protein
MGRIVLGVFLCVLIAESPVRADWSPGGTLVGSAEELFISTPPSLLSDHDGGAILVWSLRSPIPPYFSGVFAQRIDSRGQFLWFPDGVQCTSWGATSSVATPYGAGGVITAWTDSRNGNNDVFVQRVESNGQTSWLLDGLRTSPIVGDQISRAIVNDGNGGAFDLGRKRFSRIVSRQRRLFRDITGGQRDGTTTMHHSSMIDC